MGFFDRVTETRRAAVPAVTWLLIPRLSLINGEWHRSPHAPIDPRLLPSAIPVLRLLDECQSAPLGKVFLIIMSQFAQNGWPPLRRQLVTLPISLLKFCGIEMACVMLTLVMT